MMMHLC